MDRSANMRAIRSKDMQPELMVRRLVHKLGYRFRLHAKHLFGKPDLVFPSRRKIIFVHGCFWHSHGCKNSHVPKSNISYWEPKLERNRMRDSEALKSLADAGWDCLVVWECEIDDESKLAKRVCKFLGSISIGKAQRKSPLEI